MLALALLCCSYLYAETITFEIGDNPRIDFVDEFSGFNFPCRQITAILPYENGYVVKLLNKDITQEYFVVKGFSFYTCVVTDDVYIYKNTVIDIKPNKFTVESEEIKKD
jgi:hypothetical protein